MDYRSRWESGHPCIAYVAISTTPIHTPIGGAGHMTKDASLGVSWDPVGWMTLPSPVPRALTGGIAYTGGVEV